MKDKAHGVEVADAADDRSETPTERSDRNWEEILQELRVTQTGTQIISGFLLTLAFQQRFNDLDAYQVVLYLVLIGLATSATGLGFAPVSLHRTLFKRHQRIIEPVVPERICACRSSNFFR